MLPECFSSRLHAESLKEQRALRLVEYILGTYVAARWISYLLGKFLSQILGEIIIHVIIPIVHPLLLIGIIIVIIALVLMFNICDAVLFFYL